MAKRSISSTDKYLTHRDKVSQLRIIVLGYIIRGPIGGMTWAGLQYLVGLNRLGHDVYFIEDSDEYDSCYDPTKEIMVKDPTYGLRYATNVLNKFGLGNRWAYYDWHTSRYLGPCSDHITDICKSADLLINLGGVNPIRPWVAEVPIRVFIDKDPVFTQIKNLKDSKRRFFASQHTHFFSLAENIGLKNCSIPDDGLLWLPTRHPVVTEIVEAIAGPKQGKFTTVMQWDSYPLLEYAGIKYGMKSDSFRPYLDLPESAGSEFELAVAGSRAPRRLLRRKGWNVRDPIDPTRDPWAYQHYIQKSKAEFSVAKHGYVVSHSGWFSERSATYLASGRPVIVQDTGFSEWLETGSGVIPINSFEEALEGVGEINRRYEFHCKAARKIAEEYFDARKVLTHLIECAMNPSAVSRT